MIMPERIERIQTVTTPKETQWGKRGCCSLPSLTLGFPFAALEEELGGNRGQTNALGFKILGPCASLKGLYNPGAASPNGTRGKRWTHSKCSTGNREMFSHTEQHTDRAASRNASAVGRQIGHDELSGENEGKAISVISHTRAFWKSFCGRAEAKRRREKIQHDGSRLFVSILIKRLDNKSLETVGKARDGRWAHVSGRAPTCRTCVLWSSSRSTHANRIIDHIRRCLGVRRPVNFPTPSEPSAAIANSAAKLWIHTQICNSNASLQQLPFFTSKAAVSCVNHIA